MAGIETGKKTITNTSKVTIVAHVEGQPDIELGDFEWSVDFEMEMEFDGVNVKFDLYGDGKRVGLDLGRQIASNLRRIADEAEAKMAAEDAVGDLEDDLIGSEPTG